jgi:DNA modification methylase
MGSSRIINGDSADELKKLEDNSIDLLCTDPPYGYSFMGKSWDNTLPPREIFEESLRVLKPGSFAFVMSAPRSDVQYRMAQMLDEVGFEVGFTPIYWTYATGFPKAMNIGKAVDKRLGKERKVVGKHPDPRHKYLNTDIRSGNAAGGGHTNAARESGLITAPASDEAKKLDGSYAGYQPKPAVEVVIVAMKPLDKKKGYVDQALDNGKGVTWLDDCRIPFAGMSDMNAGWWGITKEEQSEALSKYHIDHKGYDDGSYSGNRSKDYEQFLKDNVAGHQKFIEKRDDEMYGGGWGKPARKTTKRKPREENTVFKTSGFKSEENDTAEASPFGRFAANLLVSDDVLNDGIHRKSKHNPNPSAALDGNTWGGTIQTNRGPRGFDDEGSFSRYYSLDAWWEDRVQKLPDEVKRTFPFLAVPKPSKSEKNMGLDKFDKQQKIFNGQSDKPSTDMKGVEQKFTTQPSANNHPTVKPTTLMSYLVTLGSRKDDVVLDPFSGSGTTGIACVFSERNYILIEREKEYFKIMEARIKKAKNPADLVQHEWF